MKVPRYNANKDELMKTFTKADGPQQEQAQIEDENHRLVLELYTDRAGYLRLATNSRLRDREKVTVDGVASLVQEHNQQCLGKTFPSIFSSRTYPVSDSQSDNRHASLKCSYSSVQAHRLPITLPERKRCSHPSFFAPSLKRHKPSIVSAPEAGINTSDADNEDDCPDNRSDDDGEPLLDIESDQFDYLTPDNDKAIEDHFIKGLCQVGQLTLRKVLKAWVKVKQPQKQTNFPYNGGKNAEEQNPRNPGLLTAPDWWPDQDGWPDKGCRHKEPDHIKKTERTILSLRLLSLTGCDDSFTVDRMKESTDSIVMSDDQRRMLDQVYNVRRKQQAYLDGEIDGCTRIPVFKPKPQLSRRKAKANRRKSAREVKRERRVTSEAVEQSNQGTPATTPECVQSFASSNTSLTPVKMEPQPPIVDYESYMQAQYTPTNDIVRFDSVIPNPGVSYGPMYASGNPFQPNQNSFTQEVLPFVGQTPPMEAAMACGLSKRGRMPFRNGNGYLRRPTSVCKQNSPSYQDGVIDREVGYNFIDDTSKDLRPPLTSSGYPHTGLLIPLDDPNNHQHGALPPDEQMRNCIRNNCDCYRTREQHQQGALINGWQPSYNHHHGDIPQSHGLDAGELNNLMIFSPDSSTTGSFSQ
ncbi:MAG: hypothetical protein Q9171_001721 [Xanthocarpia ochracea]